MSIPTVGYAWLAVAAVGTVVAVGIVLWLLQFSFAVFTNWGWVLAIGSARTVLGVLLLFPDVRLYTGVQSPAEAYHESSGE